LPRRVCKTEIDQSSYANILDGLRGSEWVDVEAQVVYLGLRKRLGQKSPLSTVEIDSKDYRHNLNSSHTDYLFAFRIFSLPTSRHDGSWRSEIAMPSILESRQTLRFSG